MVIRSLAVFEDERKGNRKTNSRVLQQDSGRRNKTGKLKIGVMNILALTLYLLTKLTQTLILAYAICWLFSKSQFSKEN